jgi:hypothetical protein
LFQGAADQLRLGQPRRHLLAVPSARSVHGHSIPTRLFRFVHRQVGEGQHLLGAQTIELGDPDAGGDADRLLAEHRDLLAEGLYDVLGHDPRLLEIRLRQQRRKLVSPHPRQEVCLAHPLLERPGDALEEVIPRLVAEGIVDVLEVVQIDHQHCTPGGIPRGPLDLVGQVALEATPVVEARRGRARP